MSPLSTGCHIIGSLANSLTSSWVSTCGSFIVGHFRCSTLNGAPSEMTAFIGSSCHRFFPPWVQLNLTWSWSQKKRRKMSRRSLWVCRLWRDHCCGLVMVSAFANWRRLCVQHQYLPACRGLRFAMVSLVAVLFSLLITREAARVGIVLASAVVMLIHGLESVNVVCCAVPLISTCTIVPVFMPPEDSLTNSFFILGSPHAAVLLLLRSSTLTICTSRHDSTNDSSHHVNVTQFSMWLLDARGCVGPDIICEMWSGAHAFECDRSDVYT